MYCRKLRKNIVKKYVDCRMIRCSQRHLRIIENSDSDEQAEHLRL